MLFFVGALIVSVEPTTISKKEFAAFSVFLLGSLALAALAYSFGGVDFGVYYAAGRVLLQGGNPYDYSQLAGEIVSSAGELNNPFYYAPWFAWGMSILALFPYEAARLVWAVINLGLWYLSLYNLSTLVDWPVDGANRWGGYLFATLLFAWSTWGSEQVGVLNLYLLTVILVLYRKERFVLMGVIMALALFKPNITAIPIFVFSAWLIWRRMWNPVIGMLVSLLCLMLVSVIVSPGWYLALLQPDKLTGLDYTLNEAGEVQVIRYSTTLFDWLAAYEVNGLAAYGIYMVAALIGFAFLIWLVRRANNSVDLSALVVLVNFALVPYALFYDYSLLTLTLFWVNFRFSLNPSLIWLQRGMNILLFASLLIGNNISYRYWMVVILVAAIALGKLTVRLDGQTA